MYPEIEESVPILGGKDEHVWTTSLYGEYEVKSACESMRKTKDPFSWHDRIWFPNNIPRHSFVSWMTLKQGLRTLGKLKNRGVVDSDWCVLCWCRVETEERLFHE